MQVFIAASHMLLKPTDFLHASLAKSAMGFILTTLFLCRFLISTTLDNFVVILKIVF
jgi:hypothetical protein